MDASTTEKPDDADHKGPPLLLLAIVSTTLFVVSIATTAIGVQRVPQGS